MNSQQAIARTLRLSSEDNVLVAAEKIEKERAKAQAEADRKAAEEAEKEARKQLEEQRKKAEEEEKKNKAIAEAAARLKEAQSAYQAEIAKTGKGGGK